jgi:integrase/recombinase XerD
VSKSFIRVVVNAARHDRLTYDSFIESCKLARRQLGLKRPHRGRVLPKIPTEDQLKAFFTVVDKSSNIEHQLIMRTFLYTGVRVAELTSIEVPDVDLSGCRILVRQGKGGKDRIVLIPAQFRLALQSHLRAHQENKYLFESRLKKRYSERQIQNIVKDYGERAGIKMHPHLMRHLCLTFLTRSGLSDSEIQLVSGHSSKESLAVYQHLSLTDVTGKYQDAMKKMEIE